MTASPLTFLGDAPAGATASDTYVPHVVAWNLTRRCNLECAHCYIAAGPSETAADELTTDEVFEVREGQRIAQIVFALVQRVNLIEVPSLSETSRGSGGFGSTGE